MFRTDVTTAAGTLPTPAAAGTPGFFTNGNPALGVPATVVDQDWFNRMQEELMSLLASTSITPVKSNYTQVLQSILAIGLVFDVGSAPNVLVANPSPPLTALVLGTQLTLVPAFTNTNVSTLNVSGLGALSVLRPDATVVQPGDLPALRRLPIIYDGSAWRLVNWPTRVRLGAGLTLFCNPQTGNDANTGLTSGTAFASLQGVWNYLVANVDVYGQIVTIQCSGTFSNGLIALNSVLGSTPQSVVFNFASGSTLTVTNGCGFLAIGAGVCFTISGPVIISASGTSANQGFGILAVAGAQIFHGLENFSTCAVAHIGVSAFGYVQQATGSAGNYTISAAAPAHVQSAGGQINMQTAAVITITGTPAFSTAFAVATGGGAQVVASTALSFSGSATGVRYSASLNGTILSNGGGASFFPGGSAGTTATGGQYGA